MAGGSSSLNLLDVALRPATGACDQLLPGVQASSNQRRYHPSGTRPLSSPTRNRFPGGGVIIPILVHPDAAYSPQLDAQPPISPITFAQVAEHIPAQSTPLDATYNFSNLAVTHRQVDCRKIMVSIDMFTSHTERVVHVDLDDQTGFLMLNFTASQKKAAESLHTGQRVRLQVPSSSYKGADQTTTSSAYGAGQKVAVASLPSLSQVHRGETVEVMKMNLLPPETSSPSSGNIVQTMTTSSSSSSSSSGLQFTSSAVAAASSQQDSNDYTDEGDGEGNGNPPSNLQFASADVAAVVSQQDSNGSTDGGDEGGKANQPTGMSVLTLIMSNCGRPFAASVDQLSQHWYYNRQSLASWFYTCSYGKVSFVPGPYNQIVQGQMCIPLASCPDFSFVSTRALQAVNNAGQVNTNNYKRHNLMLQHASLGNLEYGDTSCIMGYAGLGMKCPNAPHLWQLGWGTPIADFDIAATMALGSSRNFTLPAAVMDGRNFLRIVTTLGIFFINHRRTQLPSEELPSTYNGRVIIYRFDFGRQDDEFTHIIQGLSAGMSWSNGELKVYVRSTSYAERSAKVLICRPDANEKCDNDVQNKYPTTNQPGNEPQPGNIPTADAETPLGGTTPGPGTNTSNNSQLIRVGLVPSVDWEPLRLTCSPASHIIRMYGTAGQLINTMDTRCSDGESHESGEIGMGSPYSYTCSTGFDAVRASNSERGLLGQLSLRCSSSKTWTQAVGTLQYPGSTLAVQECNPGMLLTQVALGISSGVVNQAEFMCEKGSGSTRRFSRRHLIGSGDVDEEEASGDEETGEDEENEGEGSDDKLPVGASPEKDDSPEKGLRRSLRFSRYLFGSAEGEEDEELGDEVTGGDEEGKGIGENKEEEGEGSGENKEDEGKGIGKNEGGEGKATSLGEANAGVSCAERAALGQCQTNPQVLEKCKKSCGVCPGSTSYFCLPDTVDAKGTMLASVGGRPDECMEQCSSNAQCTFYQLLSQGHCFLRSSMWTGSLGTNRPRPGLIMKTCAKFNYSSTPGMEPFLCLPKGMDVQGVELASMYLPGMLQCQATCSFMPLCEAAVMSLKRQCSLRSQAFTMSDGGGVDPDFQVSQACLRASRGQGNSLPVASGR
eukprot:gene22084-29148_t